MNCRPALIMIDMQKAFLDSASSLCVPSALETVPACGELIDFCHGAGIPVFFVTRRYRADGSDVEHCRYRRWLEGGKPLSEDCPDRESAAYPMEFNVLPGDYHIIKPRFSAFFQTELDMILRRMGADTVILAGTTTPNCIRTSCYDALSLEYNAVVVSDCTSSATGDIQRGNLRDMKNIGAEIVSLEELKRGLEINNTVQQLHRLMELK